MTINAGMEPDSDKAALLAVSGASVSAPPASGGSMIWRVIIAALLLSCLGLAYYFYGSYGMVAPMIFGLIFCMGLLVAAIVLRRGHGAAAASFDRRAPQILDNVFENSLQPAVLYQTGKPFRANAAYRELAIRLGVDDMSAGPPIERLFQAAEPEMQKSLFRLHNLAGGGAGLAEEQLDIWIDGRLCRFIIRVTGLGTQQYWEILDVSQTEMTASDYLMQAPIGLLVISETGEVLSSNEVISRWMGLNPGDLPLHLNQVIEHADGLLGSPREPERIIRFDTRLFSHKGVATPIVLVASWRQTGTQHLVGSVALHGHSGVSAYRSSQAPTGKLAGKSTSLAAALPAASQAGIEAAQSGYAGAPFAVVDLDGSDLGASAITHANACFTRFVERSDWQGQKLSDLLEVTGPRDLFSQQARDCQPDDPYDLKVKGRDDIDLSAYIVHDPAHNSVRLFLVDISTRKSLENQLVQSQKMQAIGRLVAEIAHDFNNLLAAMRLYTDTLLGRHPVGDPSYGELQQINANVNRAAALVKKLLAYSRKQTLRAEILDVTEALSEMAMTLRQMLGEKIRLDVVYGRDLPKIKVDRSQLDQVLMNLAVNARDAMKARGGGTITIKTFKLDKTEVTAPALRNALEPLASDELIVISVTDDGAGMSEDIKTRIFEPFFTTKGQGEGTGLGLATVYGIVQQSGGHLDLESELGKGTTFTIYLPAASREDIAALAQSAVSAGAAATGGLSQTRSKSAAITPTDLAGQGNILFVEDEDSVRVIAAKTLRKRGYKVIEACDGEEAYELIEMAEQPFDLMISDVVMPGMDGPTLLKKARAMLADTRIVFISGYAEEEFSDLLSEEPDVTFLPKPFSLIQLAEKVKGELG